MNRLLNAVTDWFYDEESEEPTQQQQPEEPIGQNERLTNALHEAHLLISSTRYANSEPSQLLKRAQELQKRAAVHPHWNGTKLAATVHDLAASLCETPVQGHDQEEKPTGFIQQNQPTHSPSTPALTLTITLLQETITIYHQLIPHKRFYNFSLDTRIAATLRSLSIFLTKAKRLTEAIHARQSQIAQLRAGVQTDGGSLKFCGADLAEALGGLGRLYRMDGRCDEAVGTLKEAVGVYGELGVASGADKGKGGGSRRAKEMLGLVLCCIELVATLLQLGKQHEALVSGSEAVEAYRRLVVLNQGGPLNARNLALQLADTLGLVAGIANSCLRHTTALGLLGEAVAIARGVKGEGGVGSLAKGLCDVAYTYHRSGRHLNALEAVQESVGLYRGLVASSTPDSTNVNANHNIYTNLNPKDFTLQDNLSRTLLFQASILQSSLGDHVGAIASANEGVEISRRLVLARVGESASAPPGSESELASRPSGPPGLPYSDSVELQLQLAERLMVLGQVRNEAGKHKGAAEVLAEAVDVCRGAVAADAGAGVDEGAKGGLKVKMKVDKSTATRIKEKSLASALNSYAWYVFEGDHSDATTPAYAQGLEAAEESVRILRRLLPGHDARTRNDIGTTVSLDDEKERLDLQIALLNSMDTLMRCYNSYSRYADTLVLASEGHTLLRSLHTSLLREDVHPEEKEAYGRLGDYASCGLNKQYAEALAGVGRREEAAMAARQAVEEAERLISWNKVRYGKKLGECVALLENLTSADAGVAAVNV